MITIGASQNRLRTFKKSHNSLKIDIFDIDVLSLIKPTLIGEIVPKATQQLFYLF